MSEKFSKTSLMGMLYEATAQANDIFLLKLIIKATGMKKGWSQRSPSEKTQKINM